MRELEAIKNMAQEILDAVLLTERIEAKNDLFKALDAMQSRTEELEKALDKIANTDPEDGTHWFHEVANTALQYTKAEK